MTNYCIRGHHLSTLIRLINVIRCGKDVHYGGGDEAINKFTKLLKGFGYSEETVHNIISKARDINDDFNKATLKLTTGGADSFCNVCTDKKLNCSNAGDDESCIKGYGLKVNHEYKLREIFDKVLKKFNDNIKKSGIKVTFK